MECTKSISIKYIGVFVEMTLWKEYGCDRFGVGKKAKWYYVEENREWLREMHVNWKLIAYTTKTFSGMCVSIETYLELEWELGSEYMYSACWWR